MKRHGGRRSSDTNQRTKTGELNIFWTNYEFPEIFGMERGPYEDPPKKSLDFEFLLYYQIIKFCKKKQFVSKTAAKY